MFDSNIVVYKFVQDLHFFVTGGDDENELILATVLQGFYDAVTLLLRYHKPNLYSCILIFLYVVYMLSNRLCIVAGVMLNKGRLLKTWI